MTYKIEDKKWCTSKDGEHYNSEVFDTREEAIKDGLKGYGGGDFWVGQIAKISIYQLFDVQCVIDSMQEQASELAGDAAEDYLTFMKKKDRKELEVTITRWFKKHDYEPDFYGIENIEEVKPAQFKVNS